MYVITIAGQEEEGAYAVADESGNKTLYFFEEEDEGKQRQKEEE